MRVLLAAFFLVQGAHRSRDSSKRWWLLQGWQKGEANDNSIFGTCHRLSKWEAKSSKVARKRHVSWVRKSACSPQPTSHHLHGFWDVQPEFARGNIDNPTLFSVPKWKTSFYSCATSAPNYTSSQGESIEQESWNNASRRVTFKFLEVNAVTPVFSRCLRPCTTWVVMVHAHMTNCNTRAMV